MKDRRSSSSSSSSSESNSSSSDSDSDHHHKHKHKHKKHHKKHSHSHSHHHHKKSSQDASVSSNLPCDARPIDKVDYYNKNPEFRTWLLEAKETYFDELKESDARHLFKKFIKRWNKGELAEKYYKGISFADMNPATRTRHQWSFAKNAEPSRSAVIKERFGDHPSSSRTAAAAAASSSSSSRAKEDESSSGAYIGPETIKRRRQADMEELAPKPDAGSFAARMEKRKQKGQYAHKRDDSPDREADMGASSNDFQARLQRKRDYQERKAAELTAKVDHFKAQEKEKMQQFLQSMGLTEKFREVNGHDYE